MARIRRRRADETPPASATPETTAEDVARSDQPTATLPATVPATDVPAGADPAEATTERPGFRERSRMRRRLRYLRRARELAFRDVGGLVFDLDRFGRERPDLLRAKLDALRAIDTELRTLETALDDERPFTELHEAGVAACPRCGDLHGSDAHFCQTCGLAFDAEATDPSAVNAIESARGATSEPVLTAGNGDTPHDEAGETAAESQPAGETAGS